MEDDEFFGNDPFESIFRDFFGSRSRNGARKKIIKSESEDRITDFIEDKNNSYLVFELPGYNSEEVSVLINGNVVEVIAKAKVREMQSYLSSKLEERKIIRKTLPADLNLKKMSHTFNNGILEIKIPGRK